VLNGSADQSDFGAFVLGIGFRGATPRVIVMMASRATRYSAFEIVAKNAVFRGSLHFYSSILRMLVNKHKFSAVLMPARGGGGGNGAEAPAGSGGGNGAAKEEEEKGEEEEEEEEGEGDAFGSASTCGSATNSRAGGEGDAEGATDGIGSESSEEEDEGATNVGKVMRDDKEKRDII